MQLGLSVGHSGSRITLPMELIQEADRLGFHSAWTAEAYGSDAVVPAAWIAGRTKRLKVGTAIMQMPARTPAMTAMTATTLDQLSGGRFLLGLGPSGPQVAEGWHGVAYGKPLADTREYVSIVRAVWAREKPLEHQGERYHIPYRGKALKSILHGRQIPIYVASIGPKSVEQTAEIADGWLPFFFSPKRLAVYRSALEAGFAKAGAGKSLESFDIAPPVTVIQGDDVKTCLDVIKPTIALYGLPLRIRRRREEDPGPLSRREEKRGDRRGPGRARRRGVALRSEGADPRSARRVEGFGGHDDHPDAATSRSDAHRSRGRAVKAVFAHRTSRTTCSRAMRARAP